VVFFCSNRQQQYNFTIIIKENRYRKVYLVVNEKQELLYKRLLLSLEQYFKSKDWQKLFLSGGCYWLANYLSTQIPGSYLVINRAEEHCAICINGKIYDVRGNISKYGFHRATDREIAFMKKNYKPRFNASDLEEYLQQYLFAA
jgi:hypothetical protein